MKTKELRIENVVLEDTTESVGMFFMDYIKSFMSDLTIPYSEREIASNYYYLLGVVCQGRINEIEYHYNILVETKKEIIPHLEKIKPILYTLAQIAKEILSIKISGLRNRESIGEYEDRKCRESQLFMDNYNILKKLYIKDFHFSRYD